MPTVTLRTAVSSFSRAPRVRTRPGHRPGYGGRMVERSEPTFRRMRRRITATKRGHISSNREKKLGLLTTHDTGNIVVSGLNDEDEGHGSRTIRAT